MPDFKTFHQGSLVLGVFTSLQMVIRSASVLDPIFDVDTISNHRYQQAPLIRVSQLVDIHSISLLVVVVRLLGVLAIRMNLVVRIRQVDIVQIALTVKIEMRVGSIVVIIIVMKVVYHPNKDKKIEANDKDHAVPALKGISIFEDLLEN